jgi:5'-nucleotidase
MPRRIHSRTIATALLSSSASLALCTVATSSAGGATKPSTTLNILVTNDDGVTAPGINATVQALTALPHTKVIVVAPLTNQSGTGAK